MAQEDTPGLWTFEVAQDEVNTIEVRFFHDESPIPIRKRQTRYSEYGFDQLEGGEERVVSRALSLENRDTEVSARLFGSYAIDTPRENVAGVEYLSELVQSNLDLLVSLVPGRVVEKYIEKLVNLEVHGGEFNTLQVGFENPDSFHGAVLFADVTKFSRIAREYLGLYRSVALASDALASTMNRIFEKMVDVICLYGGDIIKFAGDGLIAVFDVEDYGDVASASVACCEIALKIAQDSYKSTSGEDVYIHCGVGCGDLFCYHLGGEAHRVEYFLFGDTVEQINKTEPQAKEGEVVVSKEVFNLLQNHELLEGSKKVKDGSRKIKKRADISNSLNRLQKKKKLHDIHSQIRSLPHDKKILLENFLDFYVPKPVLSIRDVGNSIWSAEIRICTTMFVRLVGIPTRNSLLVVSRLQVGIAEVQRSVDAFDGAFLRFIVDDKGINMLIAFGLPPRKHETDGVRAIKCALDIQRRIASIRAERNTTSSSLTCAIGITSGKVFSGTVGGRIRREYTIHGTSVNLANNLMVKAPNTVYVDEKTYLESQYAIKFKNKKIKVEDKAFRDTDVKDKTVNVYEPEEQQINYDVIAQSERNFIFIGRREERDILERSLQNLKQRISSCFIIEGDNGMGKTQFCKYTLRRLREYNFLFLFVRGDDTERDNNFFAWKSLVLQLLVAGGNKPTKSTLRRVPLEQKERVKRDIAHRYAKNGSLKKNFNKREVDAIIDLILGDAQEDLTPHIKRIVEMMRVFLNDQPVVIIVEDMHHIDRSSIDAIGKLVNLKSVLLLVTYRLKLGKERPDYVSNLENTWNNANKELHHTVLNPLDRKDVGTYVSARLSHKHEGSSNNTTVEIQSKVLDYLNRESKGIPRFIDALVHEQGLFEHDGKISVDGEGMVVDGIIDFDILPNPKLSKFDALQRITISLTSLLDHFTPTQKLIIKVAAAFGFKFTVESVFQVITSFTVESDIVNGHEVEFEACKGDEKVLLNMIDLTLHNFMEKGILLVDDNDFYYFEHEIFRKIVYELLVKKIRQRMHECVATMLEDSNSAFPMSEEYSDEELAFMKADHWYRGEVEEKAMPRIIQLAESVEKKNASGESSSKRYLYSCYTRLLRYKHKNQIAADPPQIERLSWSRKLGKLYLDYGRPSIANEILHWTETKLKELKPRDESEREEKRIEEELLAELKKGIDVKTKMDKSSRSSIFQLLIGER